MEIIGRLIAMVALMSVSCVGGIVCLLCVYFLLRLKKKKSPRAYLVAAIFLPATMAFWLACLVASSMFSSLIQSPDLIFGDINEGLPNGYRLTALNKMPEAGCIETSDTSARAVYWVQSLQVEGPLIYGKYDYTNFPKTPKDAGKDYFLFDTRTGQTTDFSSEDQLANTAKRTIHLVPTESFRGSESTTQRISRTLLILALASPIGVGIWLLTRLMKLLRSAEPSLADCK